MRSASSWRRGKSAQALAQRSRIVLAAAEGLNNTEIAERFSLDHGTVRKWRNRFAADRLDGLLDAARPGRPRTVMDAQVEEVIVKTLESAPRDATHWSTRSMAAEVGLSQTAVSRIWRAFGLQPHRQQTWKLSKDPQFIDKVRDVVGVYLDPPERAVVLCVDEKSQGLGVLLTRSQAGKLTDKIGGRPIVLAGVLLTAIGTIAYTQVGVHTNEILLGLSLVVRGAGLGAITVPVMATSYLGLRPDQVHHASTVTRISLQIGGAFGIAILAIIVTTQIKTYHATSLAGHATAFGTAFWWSLGLTAIAIIPALALPHQSKQPADGSYPDGAHTRRRRRGYVRSATR